jgi:ribosomal protein L37AE/L43A
MKTLNHVTRRKRYREEHPIIEGQQCRFCGEAIKVDPGFLSVIKCPECGKTLGHEVYAVSIPDSVSYFRDRMSKPLQVPPGLTAQQFLEIQTNGDCGT